MIPTALFSARHDPQAVDRARNIATYIARRIATPELLVQAHDASGTRVGADMLGIREHRGLASGAVGVALLFSALEIIEPQGEWAQRTHAMFLHATSEPADDSLYTGYAGFSLCAALVARDTPRYARMMDQINVVCAADIVAKSTELFGSPLPSSHVYELISGIAGQLLALDPNKYPQAWDAAINFFDWMTANSERWNLPNSNDPEAPPTNNLGVSHGIGGVLGVLSLGPSTSKSRALVRRIADFVRSSALATEYGPQWPAAIGESASNEPSRVSWCYGAPGLSCVLYNAAAFLEDDDLKRFAMESALALTRRPVETWGMVDEGICHGTAGNAVLLARLAAETANADLATVADRLFQHVLETFDSSLPLGYDAYMLMGRVDSPSFLEGAAGVALALLTLSGQSDDRWLRALAIA